MTDPLSHTLVNIKCSHHAACLPATNFNGRPLNQLKVGQFSEGYAFDAIVMDTTLPDSNLIVWSDSDTHEDVLQKIIYNASRRNISKVWIQGKVVKENQ